MKRNSNHKGRNGRYAWLWLFLGVAGIFLFVHAKDHAVWARFHSPFFIALPVGFLTFAIVDLSKWIYVLQTKGTMGHRQLREDERIHREDEFLQALRARSGQISYIIVLLVLGAALLGSIIVEHFTGRDLQTVTLVLSILFAIAYIVGFIVFALLKRRYK